MAKAPKVTTEGSGNLRDRLKKSTTINETSILTDSKLFQKKDMIQTPVPMFNVPGLTMFAGPSKHFKTLFLLILAKAYMDKYPDAIFLFYISEFGSPVAYFESLGFDLERVLVTPITDIEKLKFDIMAQLATIKNGDKCFIGIDSIGNLASVKEVEDALEQKSVADMSRAKALKSLFRMVTPHLSLKDIPLVVVNHTYKEIGMYPKDIVGGGTGSYYSADNIYIIGRQQEKEKVDGKDELVGYNFVINVEKSRHVREKSKIPITVRFDGGLSVYSGLLDIALESGHVTNEKQGWYQKKGAEKSYRESETDTAAFWSNIISDVTFRTFVKDKYAISEGALLTADPVEVMDE